MRRRLLAALRQAVPARLPVIEAHRQAVRVGGDCPDGIGCDARLCPLRRHRGGGGGDQSAGPFGRGGHSYSCWPWWAWYYVAGLARRRRHRHPDWASGGRDDGHSCGLGIKAGARASRGVVSVPPGASSAGHQAAEAVSG